MRSFRIFLYFVFSFIILFSQQGLADQYKQCMQNLVGEWIQESKIPMHGFSLSYSGAKYKQTIKKTYSKLDAEYCHRDEDGCYCNDGEEYCVKDYKKRVKYITKRGVGGLVQNRIKVFGQNSEGSVDLSIEFEGYFYKSERTKFGSGNVKTEFSCCLPHDEIVVHDTTNGFSHSFPTSKFKCAAMKQAEKEDAESKGEKIRFTEDKSTLCSSFGRRVRSWRTVKKGSCSWRDNDDVGLGYTCDSQRTINRYRGCKPAGESSGAVPWDFLDGKAEVTNSFDQTLSLFCREQSKKIGLEFILPAKDDKLLASLAKKIKTGQQLLLTAQTNRSKSYEISRLMHVDLEKSSLRVAEDINTDFLKSLRKDSKVDVVLVSADENLKQLKFSLKSSGVAIKKLTKACMK